MFAVKCYRYLLSACASPAEHSVSNTSVGVSTAALPKGRPWCWCSGRDSPSWAALASGGAVQGLKQFLLKYEGWTAQRKNWMAVILPRIQARLWCMRRDMPIPLCISPPWHLSADHCSPLKVPNLASLSYLISPVPRCLTHPALPAPPCSAGNPQSPEQGKPGSYCRICTASRLFGSQLNTQPQFGSLWWNLTISILIKWILISLKQINIDIYQNAKLNNTVLQLLC